MHYTDIAQTHFTLNYSSGFGGKAFDITEPATGKVLGNINAATSEPQLLQNVRPRNWNGPT